MNKKWTLWAGLILILVVFILIWQFAPAIQNLLKNLNLFGWLAVLAAVLVLAAVVFLVWRLCFHPRRGRYGGRRNRNRDQENARNITEAQKR